MHTLHSFLPIHLALLLAAALAARAAQSCAAVEGEHITAGDLARAVSPFSSVPADTEIGYAPVPGVRRYFHFPELRRLALRYHVTIPDGAEACVERPMESLQPDPVMAAMRKALGNPDARIEILELSRFPVPHGDLEFQISNLPVDTAAPVVWRGVVRYAGGRRWGVWASVKLRVRADRLVAVENLSAGQTLRAGQVKLEIREVYPVTRAAVPSVESAVGSTVRTAIPAGGIIAAGMLDAPREVERGDVVQVEVHSGAALLKLEGTAESAGRRGDPIRIHALVNGRSFLARVTGKDRVVVATGRDSNSQDSNP